MCEYMFFNHKFFNRKCLTHSIWFRPTFAAMIQTSRINLRGQSSKTRFFQKHAFFPKMTSYEKITVFSHFRENHTFSKTRDFPKHDVI